MAEKSSNILSDGPTFYSTSHTKSLTYLLHIANSHIDPLRSLQKLEEEVKQIVDFDTIKIYFLDAAKEKLYYVDDKTSLLETLPIDETTIAGYCAKNQGELVVSEENFAELKQANPSIRFRLDNHPSFVKKIQIIYSFPIIFGKKVKGVAEFINLQGEVQAKQKKMINEVLYTIGLAAHNRENRLAEIISKYEDIRVKYNLDDADIHKAIETSYTTRKSFEQVLLEDLKVAKEDIGQALTKYFHLPFHSFADPINIHPKKPPFTKLDPKYLRHNKWVPISYEGSHLSIAVSNPRNIEIIDDIRRQLTAQKYHLLVAIEEDILNAIDDTWKEVPKHIPHKTPVSMRIGNIIDEISTDDDILENVDEEENSDVEDVSEESHVIIRLANTLMKEANRQGASDIHIDYSWQQKKVVIRFRIDGVCSHFQSLPGNIQKPLISRIKIMSGLDIANHLTPQDGKIRFRLPKGQELEVRVAILPTKGGRENAVLRILAATSALSLSDLGMNDDLRSKLETATTAPYGIILVVGPTGSGKTTTLHAALHKLNTPSRKIWTAEDPIEITQDGISQVEINRKAGLDFAKCLRAFLRADPDIIMIGEIRDLETASIAVQAALTGHLVLSTLHTNNTSETVMRINKMGVDPLGFSESLVTILAQRLLPRLCPICKQEQSLTEDDYAKIQEVFNYASPLKLESQGLAYQPEMKIFQAADCPKCRNGFKGRVGIYEIMMGTDDLKQAIQAGSNAKELLQVAQKNGMITLRQDGILKYFEGILDRRHVLSLNPTI